MQSNRTPTHLRMLRLASAACLSLAGCLDDAPPRDDAEQEFAEQPQPDEANARSESSAPPGGLVVRIEPGCAVDECSLAALSVTVESSATTTRRSRCLCRGAASTAAWPADGSTA
ncbi:hypothetical protein SAMN02745121_09148 [Nannocystis exedens]|uniref:Lipoprotein n=2 Tax=Nannocystis exedens TaxID=54 RepID=A0A1I2J5Z4_9BACT|nr:hypothetical protein NAEX_02483 [Nannocystis exedens]SFF48657.1 hypothetical protein SAMN02745121_09148 [Nannocystis exedens]